MVQELNLDASSFGVIVQRLAITEARYASEIASAMLMKQQASAMVSARKEIVAGALLIVRDTLSAFPAMSEAGKERLVGNLLVSLTSHSSATPVLPL
jgi:hypothetical protein